MGILKLVDNDTVTTTIFGLSFILGLIAAIHYASYMFFIITGIGLLIVVASDYYNHHQNDQNRKGDL